MRSGWRRLTSKTSFAYSLEHAAIQTGVEDRILKSQQRFGGKKQKNVRNQSSNNLLRSPCLSGSLALELHMPGNLHLDLQFQSASFERLSRAKLPLESCGTKGITTEDRQDLERQGRKPSNEF